MQRGLIPYLSRQAYILLRVIMTKENPPYVILGKLTASSFRGDLYQIGLGPKVTWSPFVGWCDSLSWLDVYGGVEVLCNLARTEFDADGHSSSQTDCLLGFGGNVGLVGNITDNIGIYDNFSTGTYEKEVFVFTPKGELKKFPKGATVLDFAYQEVP